jgi:hypothetical protein
MTMTSVEDHLLALVPDTIYYGEYPNYGPGAARALA